MSYLPSNDPIQLYIYPRLKSASRSILAEFLDISQDKLEIHKDIWGKPYIPEVDLHYNVSHKHDIEVLSITFYNFIGVDIEYKYTKITCVSKILSSLELALFNVAEISDSSVILSRILSQKEAVTKALGIGITFDLRRIYINDGQVHIDNDIVPGFYVESINYQDYWISISVLNYQEIF